MLVKLIGVYVIMGKPLEPLVEKLHPDPESLNWEQLHKHIHGYENESETNTVHVPGMMDKVHHVARLVRGGAVRTNTTGELSRRDLKTAWQISWLKQQGASYTQIHEELKDEGYTRADVERLGAMNPIEPE